MSLADRPPLEQKSLKQRLRDRWLILLSISLLCFFILAFFSWLDAVTTYGHRHLSFYSPGLDILFDLAYRDKTVFFSLPQKGISMKIPYWKLANTGKKYWLPLKITVVNILFLITSLLAWRTIKNRRRLINRGRKFLQHTEPVKLLFISKRLIGIIFLLSIFPASYFNYWWKKFSFISFTANQPTLAQALYDFMTEVLIDKGHRFFYASVFTLPHFILKWVGICCLILLILGIFKLRSTWINSWLDKLYSLDYKKWLIGACIWVFVSANLISFVKNQHMPVYPEGTAQFFQAQLLAGGKLAEPVSFSREFFEFPLLQLDTHWYSDLPPGQSLLLALGQKLGVPWLINPILCSLVVLVLYLLATKIYGPPTALLATLFTVFSPMYLSLSAGYLNHSLFILLLLLALLFYYYGLSTPEKLYPFLSGFCWGLAALTQPFPALVLILPFIIYLIKQALSRQPVFWLKLLLSLAGLFMPLLLLTKYNQALLGNPWGLSAGYNLGAWLSKGLKTPSEGLFFLMHNLFNLNGQIWGWFLPAFSLVLVWVWASSRLERWDYLLLWAVICLLAFNFLSYDTRSGLANPLIVAIPFLVLLTARATLALPAVLDRFGFSPNDIKPLLACGLVACCLFLAGAKITPLLNPGDSHRLNLTDLIKSEKINNALIFVKEEPFLETFAYNSPNLKNDIIFARHLKKYNYKLMQEFPQRNHFFYNEGDNKLVSLSPIKE